MGKKAQAKKDQPAGKLPKSIAGVKVPKVLRHAGGFAGVLDSPLGRQVLADALVAAATAAAAALVRKPDKARDAGRAVAETGAEAAAATKDATQGAVGSVAGTVTEAARNVLPASLVGHDKEGHPDGHAPVLKSDRHDKTLKHRDKPHER
jgi:hypothetical protein